MNHLTDLLVRIGILKKDLDYHLIRASMVIIFLFFGYQKWFEYEAQALLPYISNGPRGVVLSTETRRRKSRAVERASGEFQKRAFLKPVTAGFRFRVLLRLELTTGVGSSLFGPQAERLGR